MPYEKYKGYTIMPFCLETKRNDFYTYYEVENLAAKCEMFKFDIFKFRTIGLLKSTNGQFLIGSIKLPINETNVNIRVSMVYMKTHPRSTLIPYPVQLFGTIQWTKEPVIIAHILQPLNTSMALRLLETIQSVTTVHLARVPMEDASIDLGDMDS